MGLLDMLVGGEQPQAAPRSVGYRDYVQVADGDADYDTEAEVIALIGAAATPNFLKIWEKTVEAQTRISWGFGSAALPHNQGYMWFASLDINVDWDVGKLRIQQAKARERKTWVVAEIPDKRLHTTTVTTLATATPTNRNEMMALPEKIEFPLVGEDSLLQLAYRLDTPATAHETVGFEIPITVYD